MSTFLRILGHVLLVLARAVVIGVALGATVLLWSATYDAGFKHGVDACEAWYEDDAQPIVTARAP